MNRRWLILLALTACTAAPAAKLLYTPAEPTPPITIEWWNHQKLIDEGGNDRACDVGCSIFYLREQAKVGDAGTLLLQHNSLNRMAACLRACSTTKPVAWPAQ